MTAPIPSTRERQVLEVIEDLGSPHVLEILGAYHRRYDEPIEATSLVVALRRLVERGLVEAKIRPAPQGAAIDERVHFTILPQAESSARNLAAELRQPKDVESLRRLLEMALEETRGSRPAASSGQAPVDARS